MQHTQTIIHIIFLIFTAQPFCRRIALFTRQSLLVAYMALGAILGPWGLKYVNDSGMIQQAGDIGIIFLLFLLGLDLQPKNLLHSLRKMNVITFASSFAFLFTGYLIAWAFIFQ